MPLPPELSSFNIPAEPSEKLKKDKGTRLAQVWLAEARRIISTTPPDPAEASELLTVLQTIKDQIEVLYVSASVGTAQDVGARFDRLAENYEQKLNAIAAAAGVPSSRVDLEPSADASLQKLNEICNGSDFQIRPFDTTVTTEAAFEAEKMRIQHDILLKIFTIVGGSLTEACTGDGMVKQAFNPFKDVSFNVADPNHNKYTLHELWVALPSTISLNIGGTPGERPFMAELRTYLDKFGSMSSALFAGADALKQYNTESEYVDLISKAHFASSSISKASIIDLLSYRSPNWVSPKEDVFASLRIVLTRLSQFEKLPEAVNDPTVSEEANRIATLAKIDQYKHELQQYNPFPLHQISTDDWDPATGRGIANPKNTRRWVRSSFTTPITLPGGPPPTLPGEVLPAPEGPLESSFEIAWKMGLAYMRATGEEERLDRRPQIDSKGRVSEKSYALRKGTVPFSARGYTEFSMSVKGSARPPVSADLAQLHPAFSLPMDWFVLVPVLGGGTLPLARIIREGLWDQYDHSRDSIISDSPAALWAQQLNQAKYHFGFWTMNGEGAKTLLPEKPESALHVEAGPNMSNDIDLAMIFAQLRGGSKSMSRKYVRQMLDRLEITRLAMYDDSLVEPYAEDILYTLEGVPTPTESTGATFKNACEYYFSKTPVHPDIFRELFSDSKGASDTLIFREGFVPGNLQLQVMHQFMLLVRAELDRYSFTEQSLNQAAHLMHGREKRILLGEKLATKSGRPPLSFLQRRAIEHYLGRFYNELSPEYRSLGLTVPKIAEIFKSCGIEGNDAADYTDLSVMLLTEKSELRKVARSAPILGNNPVSRVLAAIGDILGSDQGVT